MGDEVVQLLEWVTRCGGDPRVLVVDSLSDGYGLGGKIARAAADALAKLAAQRGLCLILVEEVTRLVPTPWCFAVDTVLELRLDGFEGRAREDRSLSVTKHRFGPSDAGPHELMLQQPAR
jgi:predicted ATP-dependent serine protease